MKHFIYIKLIEFMRVVILWMLILFGSSCTKDDQIDMDAITFYGQTFQADEPNDNNNRLTVTFYEDGSLDHFYVDHRGDILLDVVSSGTYSLSYPKLSITYLPGIDQKATTIQKDDRMWFELDGRVFTQTFKQFD